jgi:GDP/UDP-N,N'-diacetylbacillosamine 2-epimerase (hydrolysing)
MASQTSAPVRKVLYLSGSRADFGLMRSTLQRAAAQPGLQVQVGVTGTHLSHAHGHTIDEIRAAGLTVCAEIPMDVTTRTPASMVRGMGECLQGVAHLLEQQRPDFLVVLGDRGEMLAGAIAALHLGIACVHVHGGERSGTVDEPVRHAISKLSTWHLVATKESRDRLIRMGEDARHVFVTGAPGIDGLRELADSSREGTLSQWGTTSDVPFVLALFHPVVQQAESAYTQTVAILTALRQQGLPVLWLEPNADAGSLQVLRALDEVPLPIGSVRVRHLERKQFASAMRYCVAMVGNSSAGIIEAATFGTPVINVGDRQRLRERNANVIDVCADANAIAAALARSAGSGRAPCENRYGDGMAGERIVQHLLSLPLDPSLLEKVNVY